MLTDPVRDVRRQILSGAIILFMASSAIAAAWSPDGKRIAYSFIGGPEDIYIVQTDGWGRAGVVIREQRDFRPEWSPDGSHLLFTSVADGVHVMMRVNVDGSGLKQISKVEEAAGDPDYSPDGTQIVYFTDEPLPRDLHVRDVATGKSVALTATPDFDEASPRWALDGLRVVFVGTEKTEGAEGDIWTLEIETGKRRNLTSSPAIGEFHPDWSHDGKRVIYIRVKDGAFDVATRSVETGVETIVAGGNGYAVLAPHFSPDDRFVSFTRTDFAEKGEGMPAIVLKSLEDGSERTIARSLYLSQMEESKN
jgi:TolB protein